MKTVAIFSGGLDSTVLLAQLQRAGDELLALSIDYGQRHRKELQFAEATAKRLGIEWRLADLRAITPLLAGSSLTSAEVAVPHGHYAEDSMKATVVPNRNMIMLSIAAGWALSRKCDRVAYGAHAGDHTIYPDCRPEFVAAMGHSFSLCDWQLLALYCPFLRKSKADIVRTGAELGVDFTATWSCYEGGEIHCGQCGTCVERREAFALAGVSDPTTYAETGDLPLLGTPGRGSG
jgi:7-cyano-7-deazaguanine synthase